MHIFQVGSTPTILLKEFCNGNYRCRTLFDLRVFIVQTVLHSTPQTLTGGPVVVLPMARSKEGLPIGVQLAGKRWSDMQLLNTAGQLAQVTGPFQRPPGYSIV